MWMWKERVWRLSLSKGIMLFGGICSEGSLPRKQLIFFTDWLHDECVAIGKEKKTLNGEWYGIFTQNTFADRDINMKIYVKILRFFAYKC